MRQAYPSQGDTVQGRQGFQLRPGISRLIHLVLKLIGGYLCGSSFFILVFIRQFIRCQFIRCQFILICLLSGLPFI